jgi:hypothetical protein
LEFRGPVQGGCAGFGFTLSNLVYADISLYEPKYALVDQDYFDQAFISSAIHGL